MKLKMVLKTTFNIMIKAVTPQRGLLWADSAGRQLCKWFHLLTNHVYSTFIRRIQFKHTFFDHITNIQTTSSSRMCQTVSLSQHIHEAQLLHCSISVQCKRHFNMFNRLSVNHECDRRTNRRTGWRSGRYTALKHETNKSQFTIANLLVIGNIHLWRPGMNSCPLPLWLRPASRNNTCLLRCTLNMFSMSTGWYPEQYRVNFEVFRVLCASQPMTDNTELCQW